LYYVKKKKQIHQYLLKKIGVENKKTTRHVAHTHSRTQNICSFYSDDNVIT